MNTEALLCIYFFHLIFPLKNKGKNRKQQKICLREGKEKAKRLNETTESSKEAPDPYLILRWRKKIATTKKCVL
jgi:hypothetical protein